MMRHMSPKDANAVLRSFAGIKRAIADYGAPDEVEDALLAFESDAIKLGAAFQDKIGDLVVTLGVSEIPKLCGTVLAAAEAFRRYGRVPEVTVNHLLDAEREVIETMDKIRRMSMRLRDVLEVKILADGGNNE